MIKKVFLLIILLLSFFTYSQELTEEDKKILQRKSDSLQKILAKDDISQKEIIDNTLNLAQISHLSGDFDKARSLIIEAHKIAVNAKDTLYLGATNKAKAVLSVYKGEFKASINYGKKALEYFKAAHNNPKDLTLQINSIYKLISDSYSYTNNYGKATEALLKSQNYIPKDNDTLAKQLEIDALNSLGFIYSEVENNIAAIQHLKEALELENQIDDKYGKANTYNAIAIIYSKQKDEKKALEYYDLAKKIYIEIEDYGGLAATLNNIGISYYELKDYNKAEELLKESIELCNKINPNSYIYSDSHLYLGKTYIAQDRLDLGLINITKSTEIATRLNIPTLIIDNLLVKAEVAEKNKNQGKVLEYLNESLNLTGSTETVELKQRVYKKLSDAYKNLNNEKSIYFLEKYNTIKDSVFNVQKMNQIEALKAEFNYLKVKADLKNKDAALALAQEKEKASTTKFILLVIIASLLLSSLVIITLRQKKLIKTRKEMWAAQKDVMALKQENSNKEIEYKNKQITDFAIHISEKNDLLEHIKQKIKRLDIPNAKTASQINDVILFINDDINQNKEKVQLYSEIDETTDSFNHKLTSLYPNLTEKERRIATLVRLSHTSKQISLQLNITPASVDNYRSSLRKKMNIPKGNTLAKFIKSI